MALSYKKSIKKASDGAALNQTGAATAPAATGIAPTDSTPANTAPVGTAAVSAASGRTAAASPGAATAPQSSALAATQSPALAAVRSDGFTPCTDGRYKWYSAYHDEKYSAIDAQKNVKLDDSQVNITQEENSQFIPFRMPRYYDGVDLMNMLIQIHYVNESDDGDWALPVNVAYNDEFITFGWLVNANVTARTGKIRFEIWARGTNELGETYKWVTRSNAELNVLESLSDNGLIEPSEDWYTGFVNTMVSYMNQAGNYADLAKQYAQSVDSGSIADQVKDTILDDVAAQIAATLRGYYTQSEVDTLLTAIRSQITSLDGLAKLKIDYNPTTGVFSFKNGDLLIQSITINGLANLKAAYSTTEDGRGKLTLLNGSEELTSVEIGSINPSAVWTAALRNEITQEITTATAGVNNSINALTTDMDAVKQTLTGLEETATSHTSSLAELDKAVTAQDTLTGQLKKDVASITAKVDESVNQMEVLSSTVNGFSGDIKSLNTDVSGLAEQLKNLEITSNEYDADFTEDTRVFRLLENGEVKTSFTISGGGGGGSTEGSVVTIERITDSSIIALEGDSVKIRYSFSSVDTAGDDTGDSTAVWTVGNTRKASSTAVQGENSFDITPYLAAGSNKIKLTITDSVGNVASKQWTVSVIEFRLESSFDDSLFYNGEVAFRYIPYGAVSKTVHFVLDGQEIATADTAVTGRQLTQAIPAKPHGSHLLKVYMTATVNETLITSTPLYKDILWIEADQEQPVIGCSLTEFTARQYNTTAISYVVYDPTDNPAEVTLAVDGTKVSTLSQDRTRHIWSYKSSDIGEHTLTITCGRTVKTIHAVIEELGVDIQPVTTGLAFDFNPAGRSNSDKDRLWTDGARSMSVSGNFDWNNGGYQVDEDGDTYFCVKAGTTASIDYRLFGDDARRTGKNFKIICRSTNVKDYDARMLSCYDDSIGFVMNAQSAVLSSALTSMDVPYCEDNYMELECNILPDSEQMEMLLYLDAEPSRVVLYDASDNFTQADPKPIVIGSNDCDVHIYRMKAYERNLTDDEIMANRIADAKNAEEMLARYYRNQILNARGDLDPDILAEVCPQLRVIKLSAPQFTAGKKNEISGTTIQHIYGGGRGAEDNWTATGTHKGQGTSSEYYGESARNIDINCKGGFTFADDSTASTYAMTEDSIGVNYFNIKVNVASSENANNACLAEWYDRFNPYVRPAKAADPKVRDTMEFHPCVIFVQETDIPNSTVFHDGEYHFYACGDFGNSKKNNAAMGMNPSNRKECIIEVSNNTSDQTRFLSDDLTQETWDGDTDFEFRYQPPEATEEELQALKASWQRVLSWVVNATPEQFVKEFEDYFIKDSILYFYLFTERFCMVDNRAKNTFYHTADGLHWDLCFDYDNDTALGNNNEGDLVLSYGMEDTDQIGTKSVFNAADSRLFCYVRDYMYSDLQSLFQRLESQGAWSAAGTLAFFEAYQSVKPERLVMADMRRKYLRPYEDNSTTSYLPMCYGSKKHQRRQFETYQEKYISSKYMGSACTSDVITMRCYTPANWTGVKPDGTLHITPYADMYLVNRFGSNFTRIRAKRGQTYNIPCPIDVMNDTEVYTYNASLIRSMGDISACYIGYCDFSAGRKLTDLLIGSSVKGYSNTNMTSFGVGSNALLERINLQNLPNLKQALSVTGCINLEELYAEGSGITGVAFADGGGIKIVRIPAVTSITARNLAVLEDFQAESWDRLTSLSVENCPTIDVLPILKQAGSLNRVRLTGINWTLEDTSLTDRLLAMAGIDENGYNTAQSVLSGTVHVPVMRQNQLDIYQAAWPYLDVAYNTMIEQYLVTFVNDDGSVLERQYVDKGSDAHDPVTRQDNPIPIPVKPSSVSTDYTFSGWDTPLTGIFAHRTIKAVYSETVREYRVRYLSNNTVLQETTAPYGESVPYEGDTPLYTAEESAFRYHLFRRWDKSGIVDGEKDIHAVFDTCEYVQGYFDGKELKDLRPVELYAMMKLGLESSLLSIKDPAQLPLGIDYTFDDIDEEELIPSPVVFDGSNYIDAKLKLMEEDRDFTIAIDYQFASGNPSGAVLMQCFEYDGSNGLRLWNSTEPRLSWGTESLRAASSNTREVLVLRHKAGTNKLTVHSSNFLNEDVMVTELSCNRVPLISAPLVFGCARADDGLYENHAKGTIYWCKLWYCDLGENMAHNVANFIHTTLPVEIAKFRDYYLADTNTRRANITFIASSLLDTPKTYNASSTTAGGWAQSALRTWMNTRLYSAVNPSWKALIQQVKVRSSTGDNSLDITQSNCYFYLPSVYEVDPGSTNEPYINETSGPISYFLSDTARKKAKTGESKAQTYWTRSPAVHLETEDRRYIYTVNSEGYVYGYTFPYTENYILPMFSIGTTS